MEVQGSCVDGRNSWNCDWEPMRDRTREAHRQCSSGRKALVTEGKISLGKKPTKEMLADFLAKHVDACNDAELHDWTGYEVPVGRRQADSERVMTRSI